MTIDEFLLLEESSPVRHEYIAGERYAFAGGTAEHSVIAMSIGAALIPHARGTGCLVSGSDMLLRIEDDAAFYPDVMVVCDPEGSERLFKTHPCLIVEVLSESTRLTDRRENLMSYRGIDALRAYLLVHPDAVHVERLWVDEQGAWQRDHVYAGGTVQVPCPQAAIPIDEFYSQLPNMPRLAPSDT